MKPVTINTFIGIFRDIARNHSMVHDFEFGTADNFAAKRSMQFPYVWLEPKTSTIQKTNGVLVGFYSFTLYCFDKLSKGDPNYDDTFSDTDFIINTIIATLGKHPKYSEAGIILQGDISKEPVFEATDDNVNGWGCDLKFKVVIPMDQCSVPIDDDCCDDC